MVEAGCPVLAGRKPGLAPNAAATSPVTKTRRRLHAGR